MTALRGRLHHLELHSPEPEKLAAFYRDVLGMAVTRQGERWHCAASQRRLIIEPGEARTLSAAGYQIGNATMLEALSARLQRHGVEPVRQGSELFSDSVAFNDPDGRRVVFGLAHAASTTDGGRRARLQHVVFGSPAPAAIVDFYSQIAGFRISDRVFAADRSLRTAFLRSDEEHHSLAVFQTEHAHLDHHCYELPDWNAIRDWADLLAEREIAIEWGPGRHGPGNNLFLFFHDPDGNWLELSAELETVADDRLPGEWPHAERTLNLWGRGLLRS